MLARIYHDNVSYHIALSISSSHDFSLGEIPAWKDEYVDFRQNKDVAAIEWILSEYFIMDEPDLNEAVKEGLNKVPIESLKRFSSGNDAEFNSYLKSQHDNLSRIQINWFINHLIKSEQGELI